MASLYEKNNTNSNTLGASTYGVNYNATTFTPSTAHTITSVKLFLYRAGTVGTITVNIKAVDGSGHPTGDSLCSGTSDGTTLTTNTSGEWREITLGDGTSLSSGTKYAIVVNAVGTNSTNTIKWKHSGATDNYSGGNYEYSSNSGGSWTAISGYDFQFEEWGDAATTTSTSSTTTSTSSSSTTTSISTSTTTTSTSSSTSSTTTSISTSSSTTTTSISTSSSTTTTSISTSSSTTTTSISTSSTTTSTSSNTSSTTTSISTSTTTTSTSSSTTTTSSSSSTTTTSTSSSSSTSSTTTSISTSTSQTTTSTSSSSSTSSSTTTTPDPRIKPILNIEIPKPLLQIKQPLMSLQAVQDKRSFKVTTVTTTITARKQTMRLKVKDYGQGS